MNAPPLHEVPRLASLSVPGQGLGAVAGNAGLVWRLTLHGWQQVQSAGDPVDEYRSVCEFMRLYTTLRFYQLALLLGTTGSIVTVMGSAAVMTSPMRAAFLRIGGLMVCLALLVMEVRATTYWHGLRDRANELARTLAYRPFPAGGRWNPLTTSGASFYLHAGVAVMWVASLLLRPQLGQ